MIAPEVNIVAPVDGFTVTGLVALVVPHKPVDVAVIVAIPLKDGSQFIIPVNGFMNPAAAGDTEYDIDVLFNEVAM